MPTNAHRRVIGSFGWLGSIISRLRPTFIDRRLGPQKISLHDQLADLGVKLVDLAFASHLGSLRLAGEDAGHAFDRLLLPRVDHRLVDAVLGCQLRERLFAPNGLERHPRIKSEDWLLALNSAEPEDREANFASSSPSSGSSSRQGEPSLADCPGFGDHLSRPCLAKRSLGGHERLVTSLDLSFSGFLLDIRCISPISRR